MDSEVVLHACISAYRRPNFAVVMGAGLATFIVGAFLLYRIVQGQVPDWPFVLMFPALVMFTWFSASNRKNIYVATTVRIENGMLSISLPGTRLAGNRYVDQAYEMRVSDIEDVRCYAPNVMIRARVLVSVALDGGVELSRDVVECGEISFKADAQGCDALRKMLLEATRH